MTTNIKLPCGLNKDGNLVYINEAKNGLACECVCPGYKQPLVAKNNGKKKEHHFAHLNVVECEHGYQSALHYMAKDCFLEMEYLTFRKNGQIVRYKIDSVALEQKVSDIIPDIIVTCDGKRFIVEIFVTHAVDDEKKAKIKEMKISAVEIDVSRFRQSEIDKEMLKAELCNESNFSWVYDADEDLIAEKREILLQFGLKIPIGVGESIMCPFLLNQKDMFTRCVTLDFCMKCPNCCAETVRNGFICCGKILPASLNNETREKPSPNIFVNEKKVMFASEFQEYDKNFAKNLEKAMQTQYRIFVNIARASFPVSNFGYVQNSTQPPHRPKRYYHSQHRRR